jgi:hypothetical protein
MKFYRNQLLNNDVTISVYQLSLDELPIFIVLSQQGDYVSISHGDYHKICLTRFISSDYSIYVKQSIDFRNIFAQTPFICQRFQSNDIGTNGNINVNASNILTSLSNKLKSKWLGFRATGKCGPFELYLCPYGRRFYYSCNAKFSTESKYYLSSTQSESKSQSEMIIANHSSIFSIDNSPKVLYDFYKSHINHLKYSDDYIIENENEIPIVICSSRIISNAKYAYQIFDELLPDLTSLRCPDSYPSNTKYAVIAENINGQIYLFNGFSSHYSLKTQLLNTLDLTRNIKSPDYMLNHDYPNKIYPYKDISHSHIEVDTWLSSQDNESGGEKDDILSLSGDYYTHYSLSNGEVHKSCHHIHSFPLYMQSYLTTLSDTSEDTVENDTETFPITVLTKYRKQTIQLLHYRKHLEHRRDILNKICLSNSHYPSKFSSTTSETSDNFIGISSMLTSKYLNQNISNENESKSENKSYLNSRNIFKARHENRDEYTKLNWIDHHIFTTVNSHGAKLTAFYSTSTTSSLINRLSNHTLHTRLVNQEIDKCNKPYNVARIRGVFDDCNFMDCHLHDQVNYLFTFTFVSRSTNIPHVTNSRLKYFLA